MPRRPSSDQGSRPLAAAGAGIVGSSSSTALRRASGSGSDKPGSDTGKLATKLVEIDGAPWSKIIALPETFLARGATVPSTELRGTSLSQLNECGSLVEQVVIKTKIRDPYADDVRVSWDSANLYHINEHIVVPLTARFCCSWMELVASGPQTPHWFVSHWWGTPFRQSLALLNFHASQRGQPSSTPYWICTFANNQHDLSELGGSLLETPFVKAILAPQCLGTLTLLDHNVTTFERIWCVLESFVSTTWAVCEDKPSSHLFDVAAYLREGSSTFGGKPVPPKATLRMDLGNGKLEEQVEDEKTGGAFPLAVSAKGSQIDIFGAKASRPEDRRNILHLIAGTPESDRADIEPPAVCDAYLDLNRKVRRFFAPGAMYSAASQNNVDDLGSLLQEFPDLLNEGISDGATPVYVAAWKNNIPALQLLLKARADPNSSKDDEASPLFIAAQAGQTDAVRMLLEFGADPNASRGGVTPTFMAVQNKHVTTVDILLTSRADPDISNSQGVTPLLLASQLGFPDLVRGLLAARADSNKCSNNGNTPMSITKNQSIINSLLKAKADVAKNQDSGMVSTPPETGANVFKVKKKHGVGNDFSHAFSEIENNTNAAAKSKPKAKGRGAALGTGSLIGMYAAIDAESDVPAGTSNGLRSDRVAAPAGRAKRCPKASPRPPDI